MRRILLVTSGWIHPPFLGRRALHQALAELPDYTFVECESLEAAAAQGLAGFAAMVLYYHCPTKELDSATLDAFRTYVDNGGGVLAVHSATASYKPTAAYFEVLGGRFTGHGPVTTLQIRPSLSPSTASVFGGVAAFSVTDELYLHALESDLDVQFVCEHGGQDVPVVWTRRFGKGRVCYCGPGHRAASMQHPDIQTILRRGLLWVTGETAMLQRESQQR